MVIQKRFCRKCNIALSPLRRFICIDCKYGPAKIRVKKLDTKLKTKLKNDYIHNYPLEGICLVRERTRERDNHTCQICKKKWKLSERRLDVHHLEKEKWGTRNYNYDSKNQDKLITCCHKCHIQTFHCKKVELTN